MLSISLVHQAAGYQDMYQAKPTLHQTNVVKKSRLAVYQHGELPYAFVKQKLIVSLVKDHAYLSTY